MQNTREPLETGNDAQEIRRLRIERISRSRACEHEIVNHQTLVKELKTDQQQVPPATKEPLSRRLQEKLEAAAEEQNLERVRRTVAEREAWANLHRRRQLKTTGFSRC